VEAELRKSKFIWMGHH